jgi:hypothetical protein
VTGLPASETVSLAEASAPAVPAAVATQAVLGVLRGSLRLPYTAAGIERGPQETAVRA